GDSDRGSKQAGRAERERRQRKASQQTSTDQRRSISYLLRKKRSIGLLVCIACVFYRNITDVYTSLVVGQWQFLKDASMTLHSPPPCPPSCTSERLYLPNYLKSIYLSLVYLSILVELLEMFLR
ncbi:hypothetical protein CSUI_004583, partial [Cystoisospora suis]